MKLRRIALFGPRFLNPMNFYLDILFGLKRGFDALGVEAYVGSSHMDPAALRVFCRHYQPDVVFEINRTRTDLPDLAREIIHVAWLQDFRLHDKDVTKLSSDSEITYFIIQPEQMGYSHEVRGHWDILLPGTDPTVYYPEELQELSDFSMAGYIPPPFTAEVWNKVLITNEATGRTLTVGNLATLLAENTDFCHANLDVRQIRAIVQGAMEAFVGGPLGVEVPSAIMALFDEVLLRMLDRTTLINGVLRVSKSLRIFGPPAWSLWPEFKPYHMGYLENVHDLRRAYRTTRVNLHNGRLGQHFRVLDCMASGGFILLNQTRYSNARGGSREAFEPGVHFGEYDFAHVADVAREWLADHERRNRVRKQATEAVLAGHTWKHRAQTILADLARL
jgi:hypothetical protein